MMTLYLKTIFVLPWVTLMFVLSTSAKMDTNFLATPSDTLNYSIKILADTNKNVSMPCTNQLKLIIPTTLIAYGIAARLTKPVRNLDVTINTMIDETMGKRSTFDDYIQYIPAIAVIGLAQFGIEPRHPLKERVFTFSTSALLTFGTVHALKSSTKINRPDGSRRNSFPSGHTATAFVGAHLIAKEYGADHKLIAAGAYAVAATVGAMRIANRKHWFSDVVAGAGVSILSVELAYLLAPKVITNDKHKNIPIIRPIVGRKTNGFNIIYPLN